MRFRIVVAVLAAACWSTVAAPSAHAVVNHDPATSAAAPAAVVALHYTGHTKAGEQFCSGSLIKRTWVLTAAHCLTDLTSADDVQVVVDHRGTRYIYDVASMRLHPRYVDGDVGQGFDAALLRLTARVPHVRLLRVASDDSGLVAGQLAVYGWGLTENDVTPKRVLGAPQTLEYDGNFYRNDVHLASIGATDRGVATACFGDSGGPLVATAAGVPYVIGITSYGVSSNCTDPYPTVATRVSFVHRWIDRVTNRPAPTSTE